ncbi:FTN_0109 family protein [Francisella hispaniensis]|uniref:FTN_0109 family protein n=1 Tax=Francisella hispaniensis TaxID=622488 RepID=UPI001908DED6|nr:hypothetical protein [Francisella hispaniensis]MBK2356355.1 hypothetical protein [Francisella hispaniensis]
MEFSMRNIFKKTSLILLLSVIIASCGMLSNDQFVYLGHGENSPDYQLYYDKTQKLFVLIDKRNGCFQKDDTGTCLAFTLKQAREFREYVLAKMIEIDVKLAKDDYGNYAIEELRKAGITTVNKPIKTKKVFATPVRQIVLDRKQQYHLVRKEYEIDSNLVAMVVNDKDGKKRIKVAYTVDFPGLEKEYSTELRPFIIDPEYLYTHMTIDTVHEAQFMQRDVMKSQTNVKKKVDDYLKDVVDSDKKDTGYSHQEVASSVAALDNDIITKAYQQRQNKKAELASGSSTKVAEAESTINESITSSGSILQPSVKISTTTQSDTADIPKTTQASNNK